MKYVRFGRSGMKVSQICLGCMSFGNESPWMVDGEAARRVLNRAWDLGINYFDTANEYSHGKSEEILGDFIGAAGRERAVIATKVYFPMGDFENQKGLSRKHVMWQIDESLRRLKMDYVDLYQTHRWDYDTEIAETLSVMTDLVHSGKVRYIGASSMWAWQFAKSLYVSDMKGYERFVSMQNLYNLLYREEEREMIPLCMSENIALIPWSPTAAGILSGQYFRNGQITITEKDSDRVAPGSIGHLRYVRPASHEIVKRMLELASNKGVKPSQIAIAWLIHKGVTAPIIGTSKVEHLNELVGALDISISSKESEYLEEPYTPQPLTASWR